MKKITTATLALCMATLMGCSSSDDEDELVLPEIVNQFETDVVWQESVGSGVEHYFSRLSPAVYKDTIYVASREGQIEALSLTNGDTLWETDVREDLSFWPWSDNGTAKLSGGILQAYGKIYVGSEHGFIIALDRETGEEVWRKNVPGEALSKPAAGDGLIFVNLGSGKLLALHPDTGEERWNFEQEVPPLTLRGQSSPTVANGGVLVGLETGKLSVLISESGYSAWSAEIAVAKGASEFERLVDVDTQPIISGPYAYAIAYNGNLAAVDIRSGNVVWKREYSSYREIAMDAQTIYLVDSEGVIYALDKNSGIERWSQPALRGWYLTGPAVADSHLALGDQEGNLHWLNKDTGELVSREEFDSSGFFVEPVVADDKLILYTRDGEVSVVNTPN
ncbi:MULTISPECIES: outer membrane protein assembly factor BamB [unclassified Pseudoalteromonas]|uniref:outer membrane protein assembly factor BamB n=1 Tax=unclassified Pseudoalteromonas TaxID=194690 RepID=UPI0023582947|nr:MULTISPECIES: outer membrane protein assembly factor BamB [unclassified Pseudoalteromonas]MDC9565338.1 outer membrane protein assembly factor BamB [Pseudoalteromonas sp. GAB2316C]MDC9569657.1 outer membrane protein assembly factor BamB [Pseudoalteromonas sp. GABNB9D]MDC9574232.1 outer membrane protein assembly factor BamB [Pseudoalteromonas sp. GABNS16A]MDC9578188.1 outer membrane protein assembly factor BamB [Pseudoalteromonas sp. GABNS16E]MDC9585781.1 outer membrane protein assembly facto